MMQLNYKLLTPVIAISTFADALDIRGNSNGGTNGLGPSLCRNGSGSVKERRHRHLAP